MNRRIPKVFQWLIGLLAQERDRHIIEGDIQQLFNETKGYSPLKRVWILTKEALGLLKFSISQQQMQNRPTGIHYNLFLTIFRSLAKRPLFSFINLFGLSTSLFCIILIFSYVKSELSFDRYHVDHDQIFRVTYQENENEPVDGHWARVPVDWVNELQDAFPHIRSLARFQDFRPRKIKVGDKIFREEFAYSVDASALDIFTYDFLEGDQRALANPNSAVLTLSLATKYFPGQSALGKEITTYRPDGKQDRFVVKGVIADIPPNTHLPINLLTTINSTTDRTGWAYVYIKLSNGSKVQEIRQHLRDFVATRSQIDPIQKLNLQPIADIHLKSSLSREITPNSRWSYIIIFGLVGILILAIAIINFANLNTLQSLSRTKEVGIRKVLGGSKGQTFKYFIFEALIITTGSMIVALSIFFLAKAPIESVLGLGKIIVNKTEVIGLLILVLVTVPVISAYYPSRVLSHLSPLIALKKNAVLGKRSIMKKVLLGLQFAMASALIACLLIVQKQFDYLQNKHLGLDKENVLVVEEIPEDSKRKITTIKSELGQIPGVKSVSAMMELPSRAVRDGILLTRVGDENEGVGMDIQIVDTDFFELLNLELAAGQWVSFTTSTPMPPAGTSFEGILEYLKTQERDYVINQTAAEMMGWSDPEQAIGQKVTPTNPFYELQEGQIVGVVKDYHQEGLRASVDPALLMIEPIWLRHCLIKIEAGKYRDVLAAVEDYWKTNYPESPFETTFLDLEWDRLYQSEKTQMTLIRSFSILAIVIAVLGLFGVLGFILNSRRKEMAVRRVVGANQQLLAALVSKEYLIPILMGVVLSMPLVWYGMRVWLNEYAYHIEIPYMAFGITALISSVIALIAICSQVLSSLKNPAEILRSE